MVAEVKTQLPPIQIIGRVSSLPIIRSALSCAVEGYGKIKGSNPLITNTISAAEQSLNYVAALVVSNPLTGKLEKIISIADNLACQGLEKLVATVPVITQSPEEIYTASLEKVGEFKKYGNEKVQGLKDMGMQKVEHALSNPYAQALSKIVDSAVELTDKTVDHYLPAAEDEPKADATTDQGVVSKMGTLSSKVRRRVLRQCVNSFRTYMTPVYGMANIIPKPK